MELEEESNNKDFLIKRIIINLENERILPAIYNAIAYAKSQDDGEKKAAELTKLIEGQEFYRKLGFLDIIKSEHETATEYFDDDKDDDPYSYDEKTEEKIRGIKKKLLAFVAQAIKERDSDALEKLMEVINQ